MQEHLGVFHAPLFKSDMPKKLHAQHTLQRLLLGKCISSTVLQQQDLPLSVS